MSTITFPQVDTVPIGIPPAAIGDHDFTILPHYGETSSTHTLNYLGQARTAEVDFPIQARIVCGSRIKD